MNRNNELAEDELLLQILPIQVYNTEYEIDRNKIISTGKNETGKKKKSNEQVIDMQTVENQYEFNKDFFIFIAAMYVVTSVDKRVTQAEGKFLLRSIRNKENRQIILDFNQKVDDDNLEIQYTKLIPFAKKLPSRSKTAIMKNLIKAAKSDRKVDDEEIDEILRIAEEISAIEQAKVQLRLMLGIEI